MEERIYHIFSSTHNMVIASNAEFVSQHAFIFRGHDQPIIEDPFDLLAVRWIQTVLTPCVNAASEKKNQCRTTGRDSL